MITLKTLFAVLCYVALTNATLIIDNIFGTSNPKYSNFTCLLFKTDKNETSMNVFVDFAFDMETFLISGTLSVPKDKNDQNYERVIMHSTINACKMLQGVMGDFFAKMIMESLKKFATFDLKCPFPKGHYAVKNFTLSNTFIPSYLLLNDLKFMIMSKLTGKVANQKGFKYLFTTKTYGTILKKISIPDLQFV